MHTNYEAELAERVYADINEYIEQFPVYKVHSTDPNMSLTYVVKHRACGRMFQNKMTVKLWHRTSSDRSHMVVSDKFIA